MLDENGDALLRIPLFVATVPRERPAVPARVIDALRSRERETTSSTFEYRHFTFSLEEFDQCNDSSLLFIAWLSQGRYVIEGPWKLLREVTPVHLGADRCIVALDRAITAPRVDGYDVDFDFEFKRRLALMLAASKADLNALMPLDDHISEATWKRFEEKWVPMKRRG